jgi:hypothetical protein
MNASQIKKLFQQTQSQPDLLDEINIDELLESIENVDTDYLEDKTLSDINEEILNTLSELKIKKKQKKEFCDKLIGYRVVDDIYQLHTGKAVKVIRIKDSQNIPVTNYSLVYYGRVMTIKFTDNGANIVCKPPYGTNIIQYRYDNFITFQQLSMEEQLILMAYQKIQEEDDENDEDKDNNTC